MICLGKGNRERGRRRLRTATVAATAALALVAARPLSADSKDLLGWLEMVEVGESRLTMKAKLDTGADTSSLDATRIRRYRSSGRTWVEFRVESEGGDRKVTFRRPVVRMVRIKEHDGEHQRRPVVEVEICLGTHWKRVQVSLIDRSEFTYPLLLGRRALEGLAVVDPELSYTREPGCRRKKKP
jgi:hypothetical protein